MGANVSDIITSAVVTERIEPALHTSGHRNSPCRHCPGDNTKFRTYPAKVLVHYRCGAGYKAAIWACSRHLPNVGHEVAVVLGDDPHSFGYGQPVRVYAPSEHWHGELATGKGARTKSTVFWRLESAREALAAALAEGITQKLARDVLPHGAGRRDVILDVPIMALALKHCTGAA